ncbi:MAG: hypothetical protein IT160_07080 [Bryobacterales bacterium]|nr:hypothetical protein [Bryobacterales bacterium]
MLGAYPTDRYYDPNRPAWLPHWVDTPTESALKWGLYPGVSTMQPLPAPPAPAGPAAPQTREQMTVPGAWTPDMAIQQGWQNTLQRWTQFFTDQANQEATRQMQQDQKQKWLVYAGIAAAVLLLIWLMRRQ